VVAGILTVPLLPRDAVLAQQPACLHSGNESIAEQIRRRQALTFARQINSAQVIARQQTIVLAVTPPVRRLRRECIAEGGSPFREGVPR